MIFGGKSGRSALLCSGSPFPSSQEGWPERPGWYSGGVPCEAGGGGIQEENHSNTTVKNS